MRAEADPFLHHPELRDYIADPFQSFFRSFTNAKLEALMRERGAPLGWWHSDEEREAMRAETLAGRRDGDLWVFAYGSLMWDPSIRFAEVRRARVPDHARRFILKDVYGGRGTFDSPGLMAALDHVDRLEGVCDGEGCDGLLFRIARNHIEAETRILWQREKILPAYTASFVEAFIAGEPIEALTFVADHEAEIIDATLTREEQIHLLATGSGVFGTSLDYLRNIATKFAALGIEDEEVSTLLRDTEAYFADRP